MQINGGTAQAIIIALLAALALATAWGVFGAKQNADHDLLIEIRTELKEIRLELKESNEGWRDGDLQLERRLIRLEESNTWDH